MDAPKCRLCHKRHYGACPVPDVVEASQKKKIEATPGSAVKLTENDSGLIVEGICPHCRTDLDAVNRRLKYQRELMRVRRAKGKDDG